MKFRIQEKPLLWFLLDEFCILYDRAVMFESPGNQFGSDFVHDLSIVTYFPS